MSLRQDAPRMLELFTLDAHRGVARAEAGSLVINPVIYLEILNPAA